MNGFLGMLDQQKKRVNESTFTLGIGKANAQWETIKMVENEANYLCESLKTYLPKNTVLKPNSVDMQTFSTLSGHCRIRVKAQITAVEKKKVSIKVHCHELGENGKHEKLIMAKYDYKRLNS